MAPPVTESCQLSLAAGGTATTTSCHLLHLTSHTNCVISHFSHLTTQYPVSQVTSGIFHSHWDWDWRVATVTVSGKPLTLLGRLTGRPRPLPGLGLRLAGEAGLGPGEGEEG